MGWRGDSSKGDWMPASEADAVDTSHMLTIPSDVPAGTARNLSDKERRHVTRLARVGRTEDAVSQYLQYALDGEGPNMEILHDPAYRQCCDDAVFTVFEAYQSDCAPTPERERYPRKILPRKGPGAKPNCGFADKPGDEFGKRR